MNMSIMNNSVANRDSSHVRVGYQGIKEWQSKQRIVFINGINVKYEECLDIVSVISAYHKYNKIHYVCDETQGFYKDLTDAACLMWLETQSEAVKKLTALWLSLFQEMDHHPECKITTYAWSRGGLVTANALKNLPANLKDKINIYTFGTPAIIPSENAKKVLQIKNTRDYIPYANPERWLNAFYIPHENDKYIASKSDQFLDHGILGASYLSEIRKIAKQYLNS